MIDDAERATILSERIHCARKLHSCGECGRTIEAGERYHVDRYVIEGCAQTHKTCGHCLVARQWLNDHCGGWCYGGVHEDIIEHAEAYRSLPLYRIAVGMRRKWRRTDGGRMPVPRLTPL